jgi:two-component system response regulator BaeR
MMQTILIVEDEPKLANLLEDYLKQSGFNTHIIDDGLKALNWITQNKDQNTPDLIILDLMLPNLDGTEICKAVRQFSNVPILMATAKVEEIDRLLGLEFGADDYVCKPYSPREIVARVKAILKRCNIQAEQGKLASNQESVSLIESLMGLKLNEDKYTVLIDEINIDLTAVEFQLLSTLSKEPGRIFSRQQLMDSSYQDHRVVSDRTIDSHIKKIRKRIKEKCPHKDIIQSVYGVGYKLEWIQ